MPPMVEEETLVGRGGLFGIPSRSVFILWTSGIMYYLAKCEMVPAGSDVIRKNRELFRR